MAPDPYGGGYGDNPQRDMLAQILAQQANPPPGNGAPGVPNNLSAVPDMPGMQTLGQQGQPAPGVSPPPQGQPPAYGAMTASGVQTPSSTAYGLPAPAPMGLPGIMQPGQLPMGMSPQTAAGGAPPMPPRY
jgi:hypothetical protein